MIELSDNDDTSALWNEIGGAPAVAAFDRSVGMLATTPNLSWGLTTTTAADQVKLLEHLVEPNGVLTDASRAFTLQLMEHVAPFEYWGASASTPPGTTVALKNGWLPWGSGLGSQQHRLGRWLRARLPDRRAHLRVTERGLWHRLNFDGGRGGLGGAWAVVLTSSLIQIHRHLMRYPTAGRVSITCGSPSLRLNRLIVTCTVLVKGSAFSSQTCSSRASAER